MIFIFDFMFEFNFVILLTVFLSGNVPILTAFGGVLRLGNANSVVSRI